MTYTIARPVLHRVTVDVVTPLSINAIQRVVCKAWGVSMEKMCGRSRTARHARPRQVSMYLARELTTKSYMQIGNAFHRDHSTVINSIQRVEELMEKDSAFAEKVNTLRSQLAGTSASGGAPVQSTVSPNQKNGTGAPKL